jgi:tRNA (guanine-N7-)-methyltransferase
MPPIEQAQAVRSARQTELRNQLAQLLPGWPHAFTLEIGCGHGHFLAAYASAHPHEYCLGVDIMLDRLERAARKIQRAGTGNAAFIRTDAQLLLETLPSEFRLNRIFVLFPDPWPKRRHHKNRLLSQEFLHLLAQKAAPGARLYLRTDHQPYFEDATARLHCHPDWQPRDEPWPFEQSTVFQNRAATYHSCVAGLRSRA